MSSSKDYKKYPSELKAMLEKFHRDKEDIVIELESEKAAQGMRAKCYAYFRALDKAAQKFRDIAVKNPKADIPNMDLDQTTFWSAVSHKLMLLVEGNKLIWQSRTKDKFALILQKQLGIQGDVSFTTGSRVMDEYMDKLLYDLQAMRDKSAQGIEAEVVSEDTLEWQKKLLAEKPSLEEGLAMYRAEPKKPFDPYNFEPSPEEIARVEERDKNICPSTFKGDGHASTRPDEFIQLEGGKWVSRQSRAGQEEEKKLKRTEKLNKGKNDETRS